MKHTELFPRILMAALVAVLLSGMSWPAEAQMSGADPAQADVPSGSQDGIKSRDQLRHRFQEGIDAYPGLGTAERQTMRKNLDACLKLGLTEPELAVLFPDQGSESPFSAGGLVGFQNRLLNTANEGLPTGPMLAKIQEGSIKRVPEPMLEQACVRMEANLHTARRIMTGAAADGLVKIDDPAREQRMVGGMAQHMWRGMNEEGLDHLREQARLRLRDGVCGVEDMAWASEIATRLHEEGVELNESVHFAGEALRRGYRAPQMRELRFMVAARRGDHPMEGFLADMEHCLSETMAVGDMYKYMMQHGWMGPGDMHSPGGQHWMDDVGGGPGRHGEMDDGHHGGSGDGSQHGGGGGQGGMGP